MRGGRDEAPPKLCLAARGAPREDIAAGKVCGERNTGGWRCSNCTPTRAWSAALALLTLAPCAPARDPARGSDCAAGVAASAPTAGAPACCATAHASAVLPLVCRRWHGVYHASSLLHGTLSLDLAWLSQAATGESPSDCAALFRLLSAHCAAARRLWLLSEGTGKLCMAAVLAQVSPKLQLLHLGAGAPPDLLGALATGRFAGLRALDLPACNGPAAASLLPTLSQLEELTLRDGVFEGVLRCGRALQAGSHRGGARPDSQQCTTRSAASRRSTARRASTPPPHPLALPSSVPAPSVSQLAGRAATPAAAVADRHRAAAGRLPCPPGGLPPAGGGAPVSGAHAAGALRATARCDHAFDRNRGGAAGGD